MAHPTTDPARPPERAEPSGPPEASPRQARALATRDRILAAAAADFAAAGYHGSSLSRILERSTGVTKGALYFHFASKEAMALAVIEAMSEACLRLVEDAAVQDAGYDPIRRAALLTVHVQDVLARSELVRAGVRLASEGAVGPVWSAWPTRFWEARFGELFAAARDAGDARAEVDPAAMARFVLDFSHGAFTTSMVTTGMADLDDRVAYDWDVAVAHLAVPDWLAGWRAEGGMAALMRGRAR